MPDPELDEIGREVLTSRARAHSSHVIYAIGAAGTGAAVWNQVRRVLARDIELRAMRLPGRETRFSEPPVTTIDEQADDVVRAMQPLTEGAKVGFSVAGNCSGAIVAYEVVRRLEAAGVLADQLFAIGQVAPSRLAATAMAGMAGPAHQAGSTFSREDARAWLIANGSLPQDEITPDIVDLFLPTLNSDLCAINSYVHVSEPVLGCPVTALWGNLDRQPSREDVSEWQNMTLGSFHLVEVPRAARLLRESPQQLARILEERLFRGG